jgi:hypothetical protein
MASARIPIARRLQTPNQVADPEHALGHTFAKTEGCGRCDSPNTASDSFRKPSAISTMVVRLCQCVDGRQFTRRVGTDYFSLRASLEAVDNCPRKHFNWQPIDHWVCCSSSQVSEGREPHFGTK